MARKIKKLLVANRGEIALRILRAADELKIRTVAIYSDEDRYSRHRYKADEAYQLGKTGESLHPYLDIQAIIRLAIAKKVDAIHPGYGFLSENVDFASACQNAGIIWVGPRPEVMERLGDKVRAKDLAREINVPIIEDSNGPVQDLEIAKVEAKRIGYPVLVKAAAGGGGRGMRVARDEESLMKLFSEAQNEALRAFGDGRLFLEKFIENPKHLEVQLLGDNHGNLVHLFERDCSVQRRFQKVIEVAPSVGLKKSTRKALYDSAIKIGKFINYNNAGTVEFLLDKEENIYFIEVNPRIQVEHTVTELVTGVDIVRTQILIAEDKPLTHAGIFIKSQEDVVCNGFAIQCRITSEDPRNNFAPDYGKIIAYRSPGGFGIRLDGGNAYPGADITPSFDSLLVKVTSWGRTLRGSTERLSRALREFRIRGIKTNIPFLFNAIQHPEFVSGRARVKFIEDHPELFEFKQSRDRANKVIRFLADVIVNGNPDVKAVDSTKVFRKPEVPDYEKYSEFPKGPKQKLVKLGATKFCQESRNSNQIQYTDTTFRDAHQSILATRVRSIDILNVAESYAMHFPEVFSVEMWGGATFDVAMRFLHECPWKRLRAVRKAMPNMLLQMLFRSSNAVGYSAYPDNLIINFIEKTAEAGLDIFRIFDSMNWLEAMKLSIKTVAEKTDAIAEDCICYTGDLASPENKKFTLEYYLDLAKQLEDFGAHIICIKDMAGLLNPASAEILIPALRDAVKVPIHLHTHDTSSVQLATYLKAIEAGVDIIDVALASMSGLTSQPNFNSAVAMLRGHERRLPIDLDKLNEFSAYWEAVREVYYPFETELRAGTAEVYNHEIPGGQYSNLRPQARSLGLEAKFEEVKKNYIIVNKMLGDLIKVTPSSKVVGDFALYMTANGLTEKDIMEKGAELSFPDSLKAFFRGDLGQPYGGFPQELQKIVLRDEQPYTERPNEHLEPIDFEKEIAVFQKEFPGSDHLDFLSYKLYPKVYKDFYKHFMQYGEVSKIPTHAFFFGLKPEEEITIEIAEGKSLILEFLYMTKPNEEGEVSVYFKLNGETRAVEITNRSLGIKKIVNRKAEGLGQIGSPLQGKLAKLEVKKDATVAKGDPLFVIEAMKMETVVTSPQAGKVSAIVLPEGSMLQQDDLVIELSEI
ncbi:MAG: pyruvate carboxylase [Bdellovibrionota bacterium]